MTKASVGAMCFLLSALSVSALLFLLVSLSVLPRILSHQRSSILAACHGLLHEPLSLG